MNRRHSLMPWLLAGLLAAVRAFAVAPLVNVTLEPRQIMLGEAAQLTITGTGSGMDALTLPVVAGLEFRVVGQSRRLEIINGATLSTTSVVLRITPQTAGIFTIPGITPQSQPLILRVSPDNGGGNAPYGNANPSRPPVLANGTSSGGIRMTADGSAFVRMNLPKRDVYVGESIPIDIEVGMRAGFVTSLNGLPTLTGNDFTLNNLSRKPERVEKLIDGKPFTVLTWHSVLAPVKPGSFTLSVESPLTVRVRTRPARDSMIDDLLGDPFMQNFFGATVPKDITVASPPGELKVLALPLDGRPAEFSGAVGTFKVASDISGTVAAAGDPLTLRLHVSGSGNFDRVDARMLEHVDQWKTYPPKSAFKPADAVGFKGEKTFEQPVIALHPGAQLLPEMAFNYFDPNTRRYETARTAPTAVTIAPAAAEGGFTAEPAGPANRATGQSGPESHGLRPDRAAPLSTLASLRPPYLQPQYLVLPSLLALAFAGGWVGLRRRAHPGTAPAPVPRQLSKSALRQLQQMETAARSGDCARFFTAARTALHRAFAARWNIAPDDLTADELASRLGSDDEDIRQMFALADEANYAGHGMERIDFDRWTRLVRRQLAEEVT